MLVRKKRNSWLEFLRILSMLFIILNHYSGEEPWVKSLNSMDGLSIVACQIYKPLGQVGVDIFVLITGYFLSQKIDTNYLNSLKRVTKIWLEVFFYSVILLIIGIVFFREFNFANLLKGLFPIIFNNYWFVTAYIILVLLVPFINRATIKLSKFEYSILLIIVILFAEIVPIVNNNIFSLDKGFGDLLAVYLMGGYIRRYNIKVKPVLILLGSILIYLMMLISILVLGNTTNYNGDYIRFTYGILPFIEAVLIFTYFINLSEFTNDRINWLAKSVFASYLITENNNINLIIWGKLFNASSFTNSFMVIIYGLGISVLLLLVTVFIDKVRIFVFKKCQIEKLAFNLINKLPKMNK